jgi:hypothetical protein
MSCFHVVKLTAQEAKPFTDGEFVKRCLMSMAKGLFPRQKDRLMTLAFLSMLSPEELTTLVTPYFYV